MAQTKGGIWSMRFDRSIVTLAVLLLPAAVAAAAKQPTGYGKVSFGASAEEFEKAYPEAKKLSENEDLGATVIGGPYVTRYVLRNQKIEGLPEPVTIELRFWKGKLWLYIVYFGKKQLEPALAHLKSTYGPQTGPDPNFPVWNLEKTTILVETKANRYTVNDLELSKDAQAWFVEAFRKARGGQQVEIVDTTGKTPSPAAAVSPSPAAPSPSPAAAE